MGAAIGEIIVSIVAGGGLVISGIILLIVTKNHMAKYGHEEEEAKK